MQPTSLLAAIALSPGSKARFSMDDDSIVIIERWRPYVHMKDALTIPYKYDIIHIKPDGSTFLFANRNFSEAYEVFHSVLCQETHTEVTGDMFAPPYWYSVK